LGLDAAVCTEDADGNTIEYANACAAIEAGFNFNELKFCNGFGDGGIGGGFIQ